MRVLLLSLMLWGCGDEPDDDDDDTAVAEEDGPSRPEDTDCPDLELDVIGDDPPAVGDSWTVWLRCEGTTLAGAMVVQLRDVTYSDGGTDDDGPLAIIDGNVLTFERAGDATLFVQAGGEDASRDLHVED